MKLNKIFFEHINKTSFWVCTIISICLIIGSFFCPPLGRIDPTCLTATGILFAFGSLGNVVYALDKDKEISLKHGNTEVNINKQEEKQ